MIVPVHLLVDLLDNSKRTVGKIKAATYIAGNVKIYFLNWGWDCNGHKGHMCFLSAHLLQWYSV